MSKTNQRNTTVYEFYSDDGEFLHCGRTRRPLHMREAEHRRRFEEPDGYAVPIAEGLTWKEAGEWERENKCSPYNQRKSGEEEDSFVDILLKSVAVTGAVIGGIKIIEGLFRRATPNRQTTQQRSPHNALTVRTRPPW